MLTMRNFDMNNLPSPQNSIEKPKHLKNIEDNYEEFYPEIQNFNTETYHNNAPHNVENCIRAGKRKQAKFNHRCSVN